MKWTDERSKHVDDRRGGGGRKKILGGGIGTLVLAAVVYFMGGNPLAVLNVTDSSLNTEPQTEERELTEEDLEVRDMVEMLAAWNEHTWEEILEEENMAFKPAEFIMFSGQTESDCGVAQEAMGPFYCPADQGIYVDMAFFNELGSKFGTEVTEFTVAYVLAHEMGHHIQNLMGVLGKTEELRRSGEYSETEVNKISVATELQADFLAGVWAKRNNERVDGGILEEGDIESAMDAAAAVGDDNIQKRAQGQVDQDAFTHGSSKQRVEWFKKGYETGDINKGNTFDEIL